ncbi:MAG: (2Fe-2S)-binding protein [Legionellales bacterium]|nr:(2Fe-2S)-binding protein [Legionellales bacterium]|tara:strand:- start:2823 stop:3005 length:183 start_codon:yes stop_codon:yes gene_type:complete
MFVCLCKGITDSQIRKEVACNGACSMRDLCERLGVAANCGKCGAHAKEILQDSLQSKQER